jgi:hypothetical protein
MSNPFKGVLIDQSVPEPEKLYIVMPKVILIVGNDEVELKSIIDYAQKHGIHPDQLNLRQLFDNPFA